MFYIEKKIDIQKKLSIKSCTTRLNFEKKILIFRPPMSNLDNLLSENFKNVTWSFLQNRYHNTCHCFKALYLQQKWLNTVLNTQVIHLLLEYKCYMCLLWIIHIFKHLSGNFGQMRESICKWDYRLIIIVEYWKIVRTTILFTYISFLPNSQTFCKSVRKRNL